MLRCLHCCHERALKEANPSSTLSSDFEAHPHCLMLVRPILRRRAEVRSRRAKGFQAMDEVSLPWPGRTS